MRCFVPLKSKETKNKWADNRFADKVEDFRKTDANSINYTQLDIN